MSDFIPHSSSNLTEVSVKQFYSNKSCDALNKSEIPHKVNVIKHLPHRLGNLLGPSQVWKVFPKQSEALDFARLKRGGLMTFAFQQSEGTRSFLVASPQIFWYYDTQKSTDQRHSYEIIPDLSACKLYFDLEYDVQMNPNKNGPQTVYVFISLVLHFLQELFGIKVYREQILNLDSSSKEKFSRHLIFQLDCQLFRNNKSVGEFVRMLCHKLRFFLGFFDSETESLNSDCKKLKLENTSNCKCCKLSFLKHKGCILDAGVSEEHLRTLIVLNRKGNKDLICDTSVYSRNRHFRLYQNTKWGKNTPLVLSEDNLYKPETKENLSGKVLSEIYFLDSLISYFRVPKHNSHSLKVIDFESPLTSVGRFESSVKLVASPPQTNTSSPAFKDVESFSRQSPYPDVDNFINAIVAPGRVWRSVYFCSSSIIVYDIVGNRFCQNIRRQHRSNNVKYVVNLEDYTYYQKCHDIDCYSFRSSALSLPIELKFKLESDPSVSDSDLNEIASVMEDLSSNCSEDF